MKDKNSEISSNNKTRTPQTDILRSIDSFFSHSPLKGMLKQMDDFFAPSLFENVLDVETRETENEFIILCKLAGVKKEQITIESFDRYITITVDHEEIIETIDEDSAAFSKSYSANRASRSIAIPPYVKIVSLQANYRDGLLQIRFPKKNKRNIKIED
ncbi:Hsp20/alpha crystallin family protein [Sutcliffiella halmapala]|uniref:Hsp20/alpha crystallin family protein n=1 Tax=Sutcliffiella halmapala TaxID=79882 RepID=UPI000995B12B|nr:Hsp20/alpha crystallin family protein [Sutcliffiella halmapala]